MSTMTTPAATEESKAREAADAGPEPKQLDALHTAYGDTTIADQVVEKIAGIAAREVPGVYAMGSAVGRAFSSMSQRMPGQQQSVSGGVSIEKGERQTAIGVSIVVEYGVSIVQVADNIRDAVIKSVEYGTGLDVVSVDVQRHRRAPPRRVRDRCQRPPPRRGLSNPRLSRRGRRMPWALVARSARAPRRSAWRLLIANIHQQRNPTVMSTSQFAVIVGIALGVVAVFAGFVSFVIVLLFAAAGLVIGRMLEGKLDLKALVGRSTERR